MCVCVGGGGKAMAARECNIGNTSFMNPDSFDGIDGYVFT